MKRLITYELKHKLMRDFSSGLSCDELAVKYQIGRTTVYRCVKAMNCKLRPISPRVFLADSDKAEMGWNYSQGYTSRELAEEYGIVHSTVKTHIKKMRVSKKHRHVKHMPKLTPQEYDLIAYDYFRGFTSIELARQYGVYPSHISELAKLKGVQKPHVTCDETAFVLTGDETIDENIAYWVGFLLADGHIADRRDKKMGCALTLGLQLGDKKHLLKFRHFLQSNAKITIIPNAGLHGACSISIHSEKIVNNLAEYGVIPRKSHFATCDPRFFNDPHYWRGLVDGDGNIGWSGKYMSPRVELVGTENVATTFRDFIHAAVGVKVAVRPIPGCFSAKIQGKRAVEIIDFLYSYANIFLDRKMKIAQDILEMNDGI